MMPFQRAPNYRQMNQLATTGDNGHFKTNLAPGLHFIFGNFSGQSPFSRNICHCVSVVDCISNYIPMHRHLLGTLESDPKPSWASDKAAQRRNVLSSVNVYSVVSVSQSPSFPTLTIRNLFELSCNFHPQRLPKATASATWSSTYTNETGTTENANDSYLFRDCFNSLFTFQVYKKTGRTWNVIFICSIC